MLNTFGRTSRFSYSIFTILNAFSYCPNLYSKDALEFIDSQILSIDQGLNYKKQYTHLQKQYKKLYEFDELWKSTVQYTDNDQEDLKDEDDFDDENFEWDENHATVSNNYKTNHAEKPIDENSIVVNVSLLRKILALIRRMINNSTSSNQCEESEFYFLKNRKNQKRFNTSIKINAEKNKLHQVLLDYSTIKFPINFQDGLVKGWKTPSLWLQYQTLKLHQELLKCYPQYHIDGKENIWISKPGYNARGVGIFIINSLKDVISTSRKAQAHRIIQKYIERPFLLKYDLSVPGPNGKKYEKRKFDIRQWVLVTSFEPL